MLGNQAFKSLRRKRSSTLFTDKKNLFTVTSTSAGDLPLDSHHMHGPDENKTSTTCGLSG